MEEAPEGNEWLHEIKFDGYRLLAFVRKKQVRLVTRNGKDWSERFPGIVASLQDLGVTGAVLDGEAVALDSEGRSDFQRLQNAMKNRSTVQPVYYVFDLLFHEGRDLRQKTLSERKEELETIVSSRREGIVRFSAHVVGEGKGFFQEACKKKLEGIISKKADREYVAIRSRNWRKVKCGKRQELVIVGYTDPEGSRIGFGALALGFYDDAGKLVYCGRVGTGFDNGTLREIRARLEKMERKASPLATDLRGQEKKGMHWVRPKLVAEVRFTEWTDDGRLRHPAFLGLREDKLAEDVRRE